MMLYQDTITKLSEFYPLNSVEDKNSVSSAWFIPENSNLPLTLTWGEKDEHGLTLTIALGRLALNADKKVLLELMTINMMMAAVQGPRFSYSQSTDMITLMSSVPQELLKEENIYHIKEIIDNLISKSEQTRLHMENEGVKLCSELE